MRINEGHKPRQKTGRDYVRRVRTARAVAEKWRWLQSFLHRVVGKGTDLRPAGQGCHIARVSVLVRCFHQYKKTSFYGGWAGGMTVKFKSMNRYLPGFVSPCK